MDEFTVVEGRGKAQLGKGTAEKLNVLRVGPPNSPQAYSITSGGTSHDIYSKEVNKVALSNEDHERNIEKDKVNTKAVR